MKILEVSKKLNERKREIELKLQITDSEITDRESKNEVILEKTSLFGPGTVCVKKLILPRLVELAKVSHSRAS